MIWSPLQTTRILSWALVDRRIHFKMMIWAVQFMIDSIPLILRQTHVTVTSFQISCCAAHVVSKSLQQYCDYWFHYCLIISDLGSALWFLHFYTGCPPMFAWGSFHARNKLLRYQVCMKVKVLLLQTKNGPTGQSEGWRTYINFYFLFSVSLQ